MIGRMRLVTGFLSIGVLGLVGITPNLGAQPGRAHVTSQPTVQSTTAPVITSDGKRFRDLNRNGQLDAFEDWRLPSIVRARDLVSRMTLEEKAGAAVHGTAPIARGERASASGYDTVAAAAMILTRNVASVITRLSIPPSALAAQNNALQRIAESGRLGIPLTISTDPRSHFHSVAGASVQSRDG